MRTQLSIPTGTSPTFGIQIQYKMRSKAGAIFKWTVVVPAVGYAMLKFTESRGNSRSLNVFPSLQVRVSQHFTIII